MLTCTTLQIKGKCADQIKPQATKLGFYFRSGELTLRSRTFAPKYYTPDKKRVVSRSTHAN